MIVRSLEADKDLFRPKEEDEQGLGPEVPYLSKNGNKHNRIVSLGMSLMEMVVPFSKKFWR
jgi:hypothetical protein